MHMSLLQLIIAPVFIVVPVSLGRPRGQRLVAAIGSYLIYLFLFAFLFVSLKLADTLVLSMLYGVQTSFTGAIRVVRSYKMVELSNGDTYCGTRYILWHLGDFIALCVFVIATGHVGQKLYLRSSVVRRIVARFQLAIRGKPRPH